MVFDSTLHHAEWVSQRAAHVDRVRPWVADRVGRSARGEKHPVRDFLFEYYSFRPAHLLRWSPGVRVRLQDATLADADWPAFATPCPGGIVYPADGWPQRRRDYLQWAIRYLAETGQRTPLFGCFGLHEWAMVYQEPEVRHRQVPLRLSRGETDAVTESGPLRCTHYDAFRFFTPAATPLNRTQLRRADTTIHDQPGCVHVTMDLYRFAYKIAPFSSAALIAEAFELAVAARELDMRASPYDLSAFGYTPLRIETRDGREEYAAGQQELYRRAVPVRERVLEAYQRLDSLVNQSTTATQI